MKCDRVISSPFCLQAICGHSVMTKSDFVLPLTVSATVTKTVTKNKPGLKASIAFLCVISYT